MPPMPGFQTHAGADRATTEFHSNGEQFSLLSTILFFLLKCSQSLWLVFRLRQVRLQVDKFSFQESGVDQLLRAKHCTGSGLFKVK